jgi:uncharacterized protein with HEPN domain
MRNDRLYLEDIAEAIERIEKYTATGLNALENDEPLQSLVLRYLQVIGEAVRSLSVELKERHQDVPWRDIGRLRNKLVHHYFDIDLPTIREIVVRDLPVLKQQINVILGEFT